jgi:hypothetical protein
LPGSSQGADRGRPSCAPRRPARIETGGWAPKGWLTEGPLDDEGHPFPKTVASPWLAGWGLVECDEPGFRARTVANVLASPGTLWFGDFMSPGGTLTLDTCRALGKPFLIVESDHPAGRAPFG